MGELSVTWNLLLHPQVINAILLVPALSGCYVSLGDQSVSGRAYRHAVDLIFHHRFGYHQQSVASSLCCRFKPAKVASGHSQIHPSQRSSTRIISDTTLIKPWEKEIKDMKIRYT